MPEKLILRDWLSIRRYLEPRLASIQCISVDIFDTLLVRCVGEPAEVQRAVCRLLGEKLKVDAAQVWQARQQAEHALREKAVQAGFDHECRYSELVPRWLTLLGTDASAELCQWVQQTELALETNALHVKPDAQVFLDWAREQGMPLLAISDMYLDGDLLCELLQRQGLGGYFHAVYVSADHLLGKYSGRLFAHVLHAQAVAAAQVVHIGDNPVSDRRMACQQGIQGIWLYEKAEIRRRERQSLSAQLARRGGIWQGRHLFECVQTRLQQHDGLQPRHALFHYGREVLGAAFSVFMQGLQERLQRQAAAGQGVDKLLFVARDGFLFQRMYQLAGGEIPSEYVYLSRRVITAAATAEGLSHAQAIVAFYNPKQRGLESLCKVYGLPQAELKPFALQYGFTNFAEPIHDWQDTRLLRFLANPKVQQIVRASGQQHRKLLQRYLQQVGFFGQQRVALIDIGWNGTVQKFLQQAFAERADFPRLQGFYFAFVPKLYADLADAEAYEGIVHDARRGNACERIPAEFEEIFEQGARSPEATTLGYCEMAGRIMPVLKADDAPDRQAELACNPLVAQLQAGVLQHWEHFRAVQPLLGYSSQQLLPYVHGVLERAVVYPTREETRELTRLVHTEDFGHDHVLDLGKRALGWGDLLLPHKLWRKLEVSAWRYALLERIPGYFANFAFRMAYLHMVKK